MQQRFMHFYGRTFSGLLHDLKDELKLFVRQETQLVKTELSEKFSNVIKNLVAIVVGGLMTYAGVIILLGALSTLIAHAFQHLGLASFLAAFLGLGIISLGVTAVGAIALLKGIRTLRKVSLAPEKAIDTLQHLKGTETAVPSVRTEETKKEKRTSEEIHDSIMDTESQMADTLESLAYRLSFRHARNRAADQMFSHPYRWGMAAMGAGICGSYLLKRKLFTRK